MPLHATELENLEIGSLPRFLRNKPNNEDLFGHAPNMPISNRGFSHLLLLNPGWHDSLARRLDDRISRPDFDEQPLNEEQAERTQALAEKVRCVAALTRLVSQGPGQLKMNIDKNTPVTDLGTFVEENPFFYITAYQSDQEERDPRFVAKLEEVHTVGYSYPDQAVTLEAIVSDSEGRMGHFPSNSKNWRLAHLATSHMVNITSDFPYINDGRR